MTGRQMRDLARIFALFTQLGLTIVVAILLGAGLGVALERFAGLGKAGILLGILTGLGGAGVGAAGLVRETLAATRTAALPPATKGDETCRPSQGASSSSSSR